MKTLKATRPKKSKHKSPQRTQRRIAARHTPERLENPARVRNALWSVGMFAAWVLVCFALILFLSGCATQKRCERLYPPIEQGRDCTIIQKEVILKDTTIYRTLPPDTVLINQILPGSAPNIEPMTAENKTAIARAWMDGGRLWLTLFNKPVPFAFTLQNRQTNESKVRTVRETKIERVKYVSNFHKWAGYLIIAQIIAGVAVLVHYGLRYRKKMLGV